jgi:hypothetical protein
MARRGQRDPARERFWRQTLAAWRSSGLSVRAFCGRRGLAETAFYYWRTELRHRDGERTPPPTPSPPAFVPVTVVPASTDAIEVRCPSGHVVTVPNADGETLRQLFAVLAEGPSC